MRDVTRFFLKSCRNDETVKAVTLYLNSWSAWSPGRKDLAAWKTPIVHAPIEEPAARAVPPLLRRRLSRGGKAALQVALACLKDLDMTTFETVFSSRHGEAETTLRLLTALAKKEDLSPNDFSLSVHNSISGLFSIFAKNVRPSTALAARHNTFAAALFESVLRLSANHHILIVHSDEPLDEMCVTEPKDRHVLHSIALHLSKSATSPSGLPILISYTSKNENTKDVGSNIQPFIFIDWLVGSEEFCELPLGGGFLALKKAQGSVADKLWRSHAD